MHGSKVGKDNFYCVAASHVLMYIWLSACPGEMEPLKTTQVLMDV